MIIVGQHQHASASLFLVISSHLHQHLCSASLIIDHHTTSTTLFSSFQQHSWPAVLFFLASTSILDKHASLSQLATSMVSIAQIATSIIGRKYKQIDFPETVSQEVERLLQLTTLLRRCRY